MMKKNLLNASRFFDIIIKEDDNKERIINYNICLNKILV